MKFKQTLVSHLLAQGASFLNFRKVVGIRTSGGEINGILKKFKDADPADFHHAPEWKERQKSRIEGLKSRLLMWRLSPESTRDGLESVYMVLFRFVGNGSSVSWLAIWESVVLVPDPIVFAPWSVLAL